MNMQRIGWALGALCSIAVIGCAADAASSRDTDQSSPPASEQAPEKAPESSAGSPIPANVVRLFSRMDAIGPGSQEAYEKELSEFRASAAPLATLAAVYAQLPASALAARWKTVHAAGQISTPESVGFLERVALGSAQIDPALRGDEAGDQTFRMRYTASVGVVQHYVKGVVGADAATERMLKGADPQIAQMVGLELFSAGKLTDAWRKILSDRGISTKFRRMGDAELDALRAVDPAKDGHVGADTRTRPRLLSVPALPAGE